MIMWKGDRLQSMKRFREAITTMVLNHSKTQIPSPFPQFGTNTTIRRNEYSRGLKSGKIAFIGEDYLIRSRIPNPEPYALNPKPEDGSDPPVSPRPYWPHWPAWD